MLIIMEIVDTRLTEIIVLIELLLHLLIIPVISLRLIASLTLITRELAVLVKPSWLIRLKNLTRITFIFYKVIYEDCNRADQKGADKLDEDMNPDWKWFLANSFGHVLMIVASH